MKKYIALFILAIAILSPTRIFAQAAELSISQLIEVLIIAGVIPADKIDAARSVAAQSGGGSNSGGGSSCASVTITRYMTIGTTGEDVKNLQAFLMKFPAWYPGGTVTGYYGPMTEKAVQKYQAAKGLITSGTAATTGFGSIGPKTRAALGACHSVSGGSTGGGTTTGFLFPQTTATTTIRIPARGAVFSVAEPMQIYVRMKSTGADTAMQARFYIKGGLLTQWTAIGSQQFLFKPKDITQTFSPSSLTVKVGSSTTTRQAIELGVPYSIVVSIDEWSGTQYVKKEDVVTTSPIYFTDKIAHTVSFAPVSSISSGDLRSYSYNEMKSKAAGYDVTAELYDLNGDGRPEVFGSIKSPTYCQMNMCRLWLYRQFTQTQYDTVSFSNGYLSYINAPDAVMVLKTRSVDNWSDLAVLDSEGYYDIWKWNGLGYEFANRVANLLPGAVQIIQGGVPRGDQTTGGTTTGGTTTGGTTTGGTTTGGTTTGGTTTGSTVAPPPPPPPPPM